MNALSEMYPVFESPFPTLLTHTDNGLGIFVAHPKVAITIKNIGVDEDMFRVVAEEINFFFPIKEHARVLLKSQGGILAFTDEGGMPWYTLDMPGVVVLESKPQHEPAVRVSTPRAKFGRPTARRVAASTRQGRSGEEGEFSL